MAKLSIQHVRVDGPDRETFGLKVEARVSADGIFYWEPTPEIRDTLVAVAPKEAWSYRRDRSVLTAKTLDGLLALVRQGMEEHHKAEVTESWVLRYRFSPRIAFFVTAEGIEPNGQMEDLRRAGEWWKPKGKGVHNVHAGDRMDTVSVGVAGMVFRRIVTKRKGGTTVRLEKAPLHDLREAGMTAGADLNRWVGIEMGTEPEPRPPTMEIPYREEVAAFLVGAMKGFAKLAMAFDEIMASPDQMAAAALKGGLPMLPEKSERGC